MRLEKIRLDRATYFEGRFFDEKRACEQYAAAFAKAGLTPAKGRQTDVALLVKQSAIKDQLVAALDDWATLESSDLLLEVARLADPDPWRDKVRDPDLWKNKQAINNLARDAQADRAFLVSLSPRMLYKVGGLLPKGQPRVTWLRTSQNLHPTDFWLAFGLAWSLAENKNPSDAAGFYRIALAIRPNNAVVYNNLGIALGDQKDLPAAIDAYKKAVALDSQLAPPWNNLDVALADLKDLPAAVDAFKKAIAIDPQYAEAWNNLGSGLWRQNELPGAIDAYKKAVAIDPQLHAAWGGLGGALREQKDLPGAIKAFKTALDIDPQFVPAWVALGDTLVDEKNLPAAIDAYKKAMAIDPQLARTWFNLGAALDGQKELPAAIDAYKKAVAIDPQFVMAWYNLGHALSRRGELPGAIDAYKKAVAIDPQLSVAWTNLGLALQRRDRPAAIDAFRKAVAIDPRDFIAWSNLGLALQDQKDLPEAIDAYKKSVAIDPNDAAIWNNLGLAHGAQKDQPSAIQAFKKSLAIRPRHAMTWNNLGVALSEQKDVAGAIDAFKKALAIDLRNATALTNLSRSHKVMALDQRVLGVLDGEAASVPELLDLAGFSSRFKERYHAAVKLYAKAFAAEPKAAEQLGKGFRYDAACFAALAAAGKGFDADKLDAKAQAGLRKQAFDWLQADLTARAKLLDQDPFQTHQQMQHWQRDADLASIRDQKELATLPGDEQAAWKKLWRDVENLAKRARASFTETEHKGQLTAKDREQNYPVKMTAGRTYVIDMESPQFDTYLRLEDPKGKVVAENDDISPTNQNSQIVFAPKADGTYHIVATSFKAGSGAYTLTIREVHVKSAESIWDAIRTGKAQPENAAEAIGFAGQSIKKRHFALATRLYREAFRKEPALAGNLDLGHRYNAACYAVLAAAGKGDDAAELKAEQSTQLRQEALKWLQADLASWTKQVADGTHADRKAAAKKLRLWQRDTDLTWVRGGGLDELPAAERPAWVQLWVDVAALLKKVDSGP